MTKRMGTLTAYLTANTNAFERGMGRAAKALKGFAAMAGVAFGVNAIKNFASESLKLYQVQKANEAVLANAFKNSSSAVGLSLNDLKDYASELQKTTNFGDEAIIALESELLAFGDIAGDEFKRAIALSLDMAQVMGGDAAGNVKLLGKALSDPLQGLTALRRAGVILTQEQTDGIKQLVAEGKKQEAQQLLLNDLQKRFGGAAAAAVDPVKQLSNAWGDTKERIGDVIANSGLTDWLQGVTAWLSQNTPVIAATLVGMVAGFKAAVVNVVNVLKDFFDIIVRSGKSLGKLLYALLVQPFVSVGKILADIGRLVIGQISFEEFGKRFVDNFSEIGKQTVGAFTEPWKDFRFASEENRSIGDAINDAVDDTFRRNAQKTADDVKKTASTAPKAAQSVVAEKVAEISRDSFNHATAATRGTVEAYRQRIEAGGQVKLLQQQLKVQQAQLDTQKQLVEQGERQGVKLEAVAI